MKARDIGVFLSGALASTALLVTVALAAGEDSAQSLAAYNRLLDKVPMLLEPEQARITKGVMQRAMRAHHQRDTDAAIAELGDDYRWIHVVEEGAIEMVSGKEIAEQRTRFLYEKSDYLKNYLGADAQPLAIVGNLGVQLEVENFRNPDGSLKVMKSLSVYEIKAGKLWRLWAFSLDH